MNILLAFWGGIIFGVLAGLWIGHGLWDWGYSGHHVEYWHGWDDRYDALVRSTKASAEKKVRRLMDVEKAKRAIENIAWAEHQGDVNRAIPQMCEALGLPAPTWDTVEGYWSFAWESSERGFTDSR